MHRRPRRAPPWRPDLTLTPGTACGRPDGDAPGRGRPSMTRACPGDDRRPLTMAPGPSRRPDLRADADGTYRLSPTAATCTARQSRAALPGRAPSPRPGGMPALTVSVSRPDGAGVG